MWSQLIGLRPARLLIGLCCSLRLELVDVDWSSSLTSTFEWQNCLLAIPREQSEPLDFQERFDRCWLLLGVGASLVTPVSEWVPVDYGRHQWRRNTFGDVSIVQFDYIHEID